MKHKVSELEGGLLDAAVANAEGLRFKLTVDDQFLRVYFKPAGRFSRHFYPSQRWADGGPIIERERIELHCRSDIGLELHWAAMPFVPEGPERWDLMRRGPTPLIAAMRAYVASKFGEEIEL